MSQRQILISSSSPEMASRELVDHHPWLHLITLFIPLQFPQPPSPLFLDRAPPLHLLDLLPQPLLIRAICTPLHRAIHLFELRLLLHYNPANIQYTSYPIQSLGMWNNQYPQQSIHSSPMIEQSQKRSTRDLQQMILHFQSLYQSFHSKSTSVLKILKQTSSQLSLVQSKTHYFNLLAFSTQIYQKVWAATSSRILKLEDNQSFYFTLKNRMKQFEEEYRFSVNNISQTEKDISSIKSMHGQLEQLYHQFQKPTRYYNNIDRLELKNQLKDKLQQYLAKKAVFMIDYPSKKKVINHIHHIIEWFNREIDDGLTKGIGVINRIEDGFLAGIRQFVYYIMETCSKEIGRLEKVEMESYWMVEYNELKNENLIILTKLQQDPSQHLQSSFQKYYKYCKEISKSLQEEIKSSQILISQMKTMIEVLNSAKRQLQKEINHADTFRDMVSKYSNDSSFSQIYKLTLVQIIHIINITINSIKQNEEIAKITEQENIKKKQINIQIKTVLGREIAKTSQNIISLFEQKLTDLQVLDQVEKQSNTRMKKQILTNFKKYVEEIKNAEIILLSGYKQLRKNKEDIKVIKTDLVIDVLKIDLLNDNLLEKEITKSLEQFPSLTTSDQQSPDSVYNCTLAGKVPLLGKIKLFPELILFQSNFNHKNLLFGKTNLLIPMNEIIQVSKEQALWIGKGINVDTVKGVITFTTFYDRDKALEDMNDHLLNDQEQNKQKNEESVIEEVSVMETLTPEDMEGIARKREMYPASLFQPYEVDAGTIIMPGTNIRKVFRQIYTTKCEVIKKRQKYSCFKEYALVSTQNSEVTVNDFDKPPPSYYDQTSPNKLSQLESSTRVVTYKHHLDSLPIPFMPKFGNVTEKEIFYWVSDKMIVIEGENATTGAPYADTFVLKFRTYIQQEDGGVKIRGFGQIHFFSNPTFKAIIKSTGENEIVKNVGFVAKLIEKHMKEVGMKKRGKSSKQKTEELVEEVEEEVENQSESFENKLKKVNLENKKNLIIVSSVFMLVLILTHLLF